MKLLIVRHGDPDYSIDSLTETGWIEAELLSDRLCKLDVKAFYCSPKGRARDTAKATLEKLGRQAEILPWLREFSPQVLRPGKDKPGVAWDWLPQDWTADKRFYDREHWWENDRFTAAGVREEAQWVWDGLTSCSPATATAGKGDTTGQSSPTRIPSSCSAILASLVSC